MTFLAPGFFFASLAVAAAVVALHFIVTRQPRAAIFPTARFVPNLPATATAKATRPSDIWLMLLRVLLVLAAGAGLARPILKPSRGKEARVILADVSRSSKDSVAIRDSVRALYRTHDVIVAFDSSARVFSGDSTGSLHFTQGRGNLSAALIAAMRSGSSLRDRADSVALVIVSPLAAEELDAATDSVRRLWPGSARIVRAGAREMVVDSTQRPSVIWPLTGRPAGAIARANRDTAGAVLAGNALLVAAFERRWRYPADSIRGAEVVARWVDGEPAAIEWPGPGGCRRSVAVPITQTGDLVLRADYKKVAATLSGDCIARTSVVPASAERIASLAGAGGLAPREAFQPRGDIHSNLATWLLGLALLTAVAELFVRRHRKLLQAESRQSSDARRAA